MIVTAPSRRQAIAEDLRAQITTGRFKGGDRLPAEAALATHYEVSTPTLRSALALLQTEGLIEKIHGKGNFVHHPLRRITYIGGSRTCAEAAGATPQLHVTVHTTQLRAHGHLIALLDVPAGTPLTQFLCIRHEGKSPHSLARIYIPGDSSPSHACAEPRSGPPDLHPPLTEIRERVTARHPTPEEAATLRISPSLSVLTISRSAVDSTGHVAEAAVLVLPGDRADAYFITHPMTGEERREG
ncbi:MULTISPECIES: GntR family transcriptional regulator [unclassified Streptomyces]|uniref:GntR family transcriptional regulator n=1 Tax=unclassified Streptomyces TaxID=2593676 RepID=UPI00278BDFB9|nr:MULTISPECIES: GntR family transcriptional regulator [unclassified Streptomyces]